MSNTNIPPHWKSAKLDEVCDMVSGFFKKETPPFGDVGPKMLSSELFWCYKDITIYLYNANKKKAGSALNGKLYKEVPQVELAF